MATVHVCGPPIGARDVAVGRSHDHLLRPQRSQGTHSMHKILSAAAALALAATIPAMMQQPAVAQQKM